MKINFLQKLIINNNIFNNILFYLINTFIWLRLYLIKNTWLSIIYRGILVSKDLLREITIFELIWFLLPIKQILFFIYFLNIKLKILIWLFFSSFIMFARRIEFCSSKAMNILILEKECVIRCMIFLVEFREKWVNRKIRKF